MVTIVGLVSPEPIMASTLVCAASPTCCLPHSSPPWLAHCTVPAAGTLLSCSDVMRSRSGLCAAPRRLGRRGFLPGYPAEQGESRDADRDLGEPQGRIVRNRIGGTAADVHAVEPPRRRLHHGAGGQKGGDRERRRLRPP